MQNDEWPGNGNRQQVSACFIVPSAFPGADYELVETAGNWAERRLSGHLSHRSAVKAGNAVIRNLAECRYGAATAVGTRSTVCSGRSAWLTCLGAISSGVAAATT